MSRNFKWDSWDYDCDGTAYIIAKDECQRREDVPEWIVTEDNLSLEVLDGNNSAHLSLEDVKQGWCKWQVRTDWENGDGEPKGGYVVEERSHDKPMRGWFSVWIIRKGEWY